MSNFIFTDSMRTVQTAYAAFDKNLWLVGGAVRDSLLGENPKDIDFATDATPVEQMEICDAAGLHYIPTGLQHGTISVVIDGEVFEITTLRIDANHDGRHADVSFDASETKIMKDFIALGYDSNMDYDFRELLEVFQRINQ